MKQQEKGKRSIALPVTLILLVMSLMGNVLLLTKNININQTNAVEEGGVILDRAKRSLELAQYMEGQMMEVRELSTSDGTAERLAARYAASSLQRGGSSLKELMATAELQAAGALEGAGAAAEAYVDSFAYERLTGIGNGAGALDDSERKTIEQLQQSFSELAGALSAFSFAGEGNKSFMIRLSAGHGWHEVAGSVQAVMRQYASNDHGLIA
ncbi:hypothetical protein M6D81_02995 [Paenibacillus sp. J5C_2022]|uniref:hypothetical protein n=1 Tax=Paenibacillus sp. J5C2022 TaxID=2977129 RepID=UPI0021D04672|nr:hypothetical protein [Paenibacillus sp. J5C2022]MCU6707666.1 hypothetical protein [Paenibacillus sp. J5C2022]